MRTRVLTCALAFAVSGLASVSHAGEPAPAAPESAVTVSVDPRVELMSLLFRLAGNPEYNRALVDVCAKHVENRFRPYDFHPAVAMARDLRRQHGIAFDAVMVMAIHLNDAYTVSTAMPLRPPPPHLDARWPVEKAESFLAQVRAFVSLTDFRGYMDAMAPFHAETERRMRAFIESELNLAWYPAFYGVESPATFHVIPGLLNGGGSYGPRVTVDGQDHLYCILGVWQTDGEGYPVFDRSVLDVVVHEFCHSFCNPLVEQHLAALETPMQRLFERTSKVMARQAYGAWQSVAYESLVRASVVRYLAANAGPEAAMKQAREEVARGFLWVDDLAVLLATEYEPHRETYPELADFMPHYVAFFEAYELEDATAHVMNAGAAAPPPDSETPEAEAPGGREEG